jgi:hypothetical protein
MRLTTFCGRATDRSRGAGMPACWLVDLFARNERVNFDGVSAFDGNGVEFIVVNEDVGVLGIFVAAALVLVADRFARDVIDKLLPKSVAALLVDLPKRHDRRPIAEAIGDGAVRSKFRAAHSG